MINCKIDSHLLGKTMALEKDKKVLCLVRAACFNELKMVLNRCGIEIMDEYLFIKSFFIRATKEQVMFLSRHASVKFISSNSTALALMNVSKKVLKFSENGLTGAGVGVAFIDTGISPHYDFCLGKNRIKDFVDFVGEKECAYDDNGHGTFVAGVCAGSGVASGGRYSGIAPHCDIYALKALDKKGEAYSNKILSAMEWIYLNHDRLNIKVVCMSFGSEPLGQNDPIMNGAEQLWRAGVIVVAAAGNSGPEYQTIKSPGVSRRLITVGGMDDNRIDENTFSSSLFEIASFSSRGPAFRSYKPDVVAPAVEITSCGLNNDYTMLSGTSVATPMIAGIMSLICERYPNVSPDEAKRMLLSCCHPISYNKNLEGYGYPDLTKLFD